MFPFVVFSTLLSVAIVFDSASAAESREAVVNRQLNCMDQKLQSGKAINWKDICATSYSIDNESLYTDMGNSSYQWEPVADTYPVRKHTYELAAQIQRFNYQTADKWPYYYENYYGYPVSDKVKKEGYLYGIYGAKTFNFSHPIDSWRDFLDRYEIPNFIRIEVEANRGETSYDSYITDKLTGHDAWNAEGRLLVGYDLLWSPSTIVTPYVGAGYKWAEDDTGGYIDFIVDDYVPFTRQTSYFYIPIGVETLSKISEKWDISYKLEGNVAPFGSTDFFLNEIPGPISAIDGDTGLPVDIMFNKTEADLGVGYGVRTSMKFIRKFSAFDFYVEPFFRYQYFDKGEEVQLQAHGIDNGKDYVSVFPDLVTPYKGLWDEENHTTSYGIRTGVQF